MAVALAVSLVGRMETDPVPDTCAVRAAALERVVVGVEVVVAADSGVAVSHLLVYKERMRLETALERLAQAVPCLPPGTPAAPSRVADHGPAQPIHSS